MERPDHAIALHDAHVAYAADREHAAEFLHNRSEHFDAMLAYIDAMDWYQLAEEASASERCRRLAVGEGQECHCPEFVTAATPVPLHRDVDTSHHPSKGETS
jgi:hypothetical protein